MIFREFLKNGKVKRCKIDQELIKSLLEMSREIEEAINYIPLNEKTAATILTQHYESLRQVVEAIAIKKGYKVFSHEALTAFLIKENEEKNASVFERTRKLRNGVNYYGRKINTEEINYSKPLIKKSIKQLKKKYFQ